jgi:AcrR family transcriptional regulator
MAGSKSVSAQTIAPSKKAVRGAAGTRPKPVRTQDPEGVQRNIIEIASEEFALNGLSGARIDEIAARTRTSKRMIYYYFRDKEGLYLAALENAYRLVREGEAKLDVEDLPPVEALKALVEFTFDHHHKHEGFIRMVMIENIHHGQYLEQSKAIRQLNVSAIDTMASVYRRGVAQGAFRKGLDPVELHWQVSALCFFNVSNRATFSKIFGRDIASAKAQASLRRNAVEMVLRYVANPDL